MTCSELVEIVTDYLEGALAEEDASRLEAHLGDCPACKLYIRQMDLSRRATGQVEAGELGPQAVEDLSAVFRQWRRGRD